MKKKCPQKFPNCASTTVIMFVTRADAKSYLVRQPHVLRSELCAPFCHDLSCLWRGGLMGVPNQITFCGGPGYKHDNGCWGRIRKLLGTFFFHSPQGEILWWYFFQHSNFVRGNLSAAKKLQYTWLLRRSTAGVLPTLFFVQRYANINFCRGPPREKCQNAI